MSLSTSISLPISHLLIMRPQTRIQFQGTVYLTWICWGRAGWYYGVNSQYTECFGTVIQSVSTQSSATNVCYWKIKTVIENNPGRWRSCGSQKNKTIYELFPFLFIFTFFFATLSFFSELIFFSLSVFLHRCFSVISMPVTFLKHLFQCPYFSKPHALKSRRAVGE